MKKICLIIIIILLTACNNKTDAIRFKQEYESYNKDKIELTISDKNIVKYSTKEEINKIIKEGTGVIFIGTPKENTSRTSINLLLEAADSTDLKEIYYIDNLKEINIDKIENSKMPLVLFILEGQTISYSINEKEELNEDEEINLYNKYLDSIHEVLQDTCDEEC